MVRHEGEKWKNTNVSRISNWRPSPHNIIYDLESTQIGLNFRPLSIVATLAAEQLKFIKEELQKSERNAIYLLKKLSVYTFVKLPKKGNRIWWTFPLILNHKYFTRDEILAILLMEGIPAGVHFPKLMFNHSVFKTPEQIVEVEFINSLTFSENHIVLPIYPVLNKNNMSKIVSAFNKIDKINPNDIHTIKELASQVLSKSNVEELCSGLFIFLQNEQ